MTDHFKELECAAAYVVNGGERDLPSAIHWLTDAFNALLDRAHFEAILEDNERTGLAEAKRERDAELAARPLAEKAKTDGSFNVALVVKRLRGDE